MNHISILGIGKAKEDLVSVWNRKSNHKHPSLPIRSRRCFHLTDLVKFYFCAGGQFAVVVQNTIV